jgi:hypothetical protein
LKISDGLRGLQKMFEKIPSKYMLMNGKIEIPLKFLVGSCCEGMSESFSYSMDKRLERHEIDMIGFIDRKPIFAVEFKSTFSYDQPNTRKSVKRASEQIRKTLEIELLKDSKKYIVHFLNHSIGTKVSSLNPKWIKKKYPKGEAYEAVEVKKFYKDELNNNFKDYEIINYNFKHPDLKLDTILIEVKNA